MEHLHAHVCHQSVMVVAAPIPTTTVVLLSCAIEVRNESYRVTGWPGGPAGLVGYDCWASFTKLCVNVCSFLHHLGSKRVGSTHKAFDVCLQWEDVYDLAKFVGMRLPSEYSLEMIEGPLHSEETSERTERHFHDKVYKTLSPEICFCYAWSLQSSFWTRGSTMCGRQSLISWWWYWAMISIILLSGIKFVGEFSATFSPLLQEHLSNIAT